MAEIEATIADFARAHRQNLDTQLPPIAGPRALLRAQLAQLAAQPQASSWRWLFQFNSPARAAAFIGIAILVSAITGGLLWQRAALHGTNSAIALSDHGAEPNRFLTPGAMRRVATSDVCSMAHEEVVADVSTPLRQEVLQEYGIVNANASNYEIDYLIAPGLGGVEGHSQSMAGALYVFDVECACQGRAGRAPS